MFVVIISEKGGAERRETFEQGSVAVGRVQGNDLMLPKGNVSKRHCSLSFEAGRFVVADHNSTNGTYVNRRRIAQPTVVREGDRIYVGDFVLRVEAANDAKGDGDASPVSDPDGGEAAVADAAAAGAGVSDPPDVEEAPDLLPDSVPEPGSKHAPPPKPGLVTLQDGEAATPRELLEAVAQLIARVQSKLEPRLLERPMDEGAEKRVQRVVGEAVEQLLTEGVLDDELDQEQVVQLALSELIQLGPLTALLADEAVSEVVFSGPFTGSWVRAGHRSALPVPFCVKESPERIARRLCRVEGQELPKGLGAHRLWLKANEVELELLRSGMPEQGAVLSIGRGLRPAEGLASGVGEGLLSPAMAEFLRVAAVTRHNILVIGEDRFTVEPLLSALARASRERQVVLGSRLAASAFPGALVVAVGQLAPDEGVTVLEAALRLPSHRVVVPSMAGALGVELVKGLTASGATGVHCGLFAGSAEGGVAQLAAQLALATGTAGADAHSMLGACYDLAIEVTRLRDGKPRITRVAELSRDSGSLTSIFEFVLGEASASEGVTGVFQSVGEAPRFAGRLRQLGHNFDLGGVVDTRK